MRVSWFCRRLSCTRAATRPLAGGRGRRTHQVRVRSRAASGSRLQGAWGALGPGGRPGGRHERSAPEDWRGAQHHGHGHQLDVPDTALAGGA